MCTHQKFLLHLLVDEFMGISVHYRILLTEHKSKPDCVRGIICTPEVNVYIAVRWSPGSYLCAYGVWPLRGVSCLLNYSVASSIKMDRLLCCSPMEGLKPIRRSASVSQVIIQKHGSLPGPSGRPFWHSLLSCQLLALGQLALWTTPQRSDRCWHASKLA
jgi:hypothetical protein